MKKSKSSRHTYLTVRTSLAATCLIACGALAVAHLAAASATPLVQVTIEGVAGAARVCSDYVLDPVAPSCTGTYRDYRLSAGDPCVEDEGMPNGSFIALNRKFADGIRCSDHGGTQRNYVLTIEDAGACTELLNSAEAIEVTGDVSACNVVASPNPVIRAEKVWAAKATATPIWFQLVGSSYRVQTDVDASVAIAASNGNHRVVSFTGTAHLWKVFTAGTHPATIGGAFSLPFRLVFDRTTSR